MPLVDELLEDVPGEDVERVGLELHLQGLQDRRPYSPDIVHVLQPKPVYNSTQ